MQYWAVSLAAPQHHSFSCVSNYGIHHPLCSCRHRSPKYCAGSNYTQATTITAYLHCTRLHDATLCRPYSYYVQWIAVVWLTKIEIEIESKLNYLQKIESKSIETKKMTIVTALTIILITKILNSAEPAVSCCLFNMKTLTKEWEVVED